MTLPESKPAIQSKAVLGSTTTIVSVVVGLIVTYLKVPSDYIDPVLVPLVTAGVGGVVSLFGRLVANTRISGIFE